MQKLNFGSWLHDKLRVPLPPQVLLHPNAFSPTRSPLLEGQLEAQTAAQMQFQYQMQCALFFPSQLISVSCLFAHCFV